MTLLYIFLKNKQLQKKNALWKDSKLFEEIFERLIKVCKKSGITPFKQIDLHPKLFFFQR